MDSQTLICTLADLFNEIGPETSEEIDAVLRESGYDPNEVSARMKVVAEYAIEIERIQRQFKQSANEAKSKSDAIAFLKARRLRNHQISIAEAIQARLLFEITADNE